jgi:hypothetical protein
MRIASQSGIFGVAVVLLHCTSSAVHMFARKRDTERESNRQQKHTGRERERERESLKDRERETHTHTNTHTQEIERVSF